ncbi:N-acetyltransferase [Asanoa sp. WMMD1127]|uniref:GNAT family N-acetyltransferase n=1 Tax=Asanoa sp. WMMD1127 TaxID=3016107 RepID=UPI002415F37D|nr:N-acetyltransferase [Asanoa sp. WMMD1127]MDG4827585.1 N-acetyltransferase [Asanoa sp. WMMD1127]
MSVRLAEITDTADVAALLPQAHRILADLVASGAALGWTLPPDRAEVRDLLTELVEGAGSGEAALLVAYASGDDVPSPSSLNRSAPLPDGSRVAGLGYWRRYARQTHRPHADLERVAVAEAYQGRGIGRALTEGLVASARKAGIEVLTLDARGDNERALALYRTLGFNEYGRLVDFVAVGHLRYDKVLYALDLRRPWPRL